MKATLLDIGGIANARWNDKYSNRVTVGIFVVYFIALIIGVGGGVGFTQMVNSASYTQEITYTIPQAGTLTFEEGYGLILNGNIVIKPDQKIIEHNSSPLWWSIGFMSVIMVVGLIVLVWHENKRSEFKYKFVQEYINTGEIPDIYP